MQLDKLVFHVLCGIKQISTAEDRALVFPISSSPAGQQLKQIKPLIQHHVIYIISEILVLALKHMTVKAQTKREEQPRTFSKLSVKFRNRKISSRLTECLHLDVMCYNIV